MMRGHLMALHALPLGPIPTPTPPHRPPRCLASPPPACAAGQSYQPSTPNSPMRRLPPAYAARQRRHSPAGRTACQLRALLYTLCLPYLQCARPKGPQVPHRLPLPARAVGYAGAAAARRSAGHSGPSGRAQWGASGVVAQLFAASTRCGPRWPCCCPLLCCPQQAHRGLISLLEGARPH